MGTKRPPAGGEIVQVQGGHIVRPAGKKDRHSKIFTAKGPRDRRLRLSAHTAIQFYDVQDRLGYDRPSKAVDWLIGKAQSAINKLSAGAHDGSGEMGLPDQSEPSSSASCIKFQSFPPEFAPRTTGGDLCLSLQSFQDNTNRTPSTDQTTLFAGDGGDPNFQRVMGWGSESGENRGGGAGFVFGSPQQPLMLSSQRELNRFSFVEPSSMVASDDHRSRFGLPEFFLPPQFHGEPSSASPTSSNH